MIRGGIGLGGGVSLIGSGAVSEKPENAEGGSGSGGADSPCGRACPEALRPSLIASGDGMPVRSRGDVDCFSPAGIAASGAAVGSDVSCERSMLCLCRLQCDTASAGNTEQWPC
jgi:hypothetical protein